MTIGFFDSGIGGIAVMARAREKLPAADYLYYADVDHVPYGLRTPEEILAYSEDAVRCLTERGAEVIVIACNTATSMAASALRARWSIPIIGMEPAVKPAAVAHPGENILVCATPVTIAGEKLHALIEQCYPSGERPTLVALPELVTMAEQGIFETDTVVRYLAEIIPEPSRYSAVVLGCTHFPYFRDSFRVYFGEAVDLIDGTEGTVNRLLAVVGADGQPLSSDCGCLTYLQSGRVVTDADTLAYYRLLEARSRMGRA